MLTNSGAQPGDVLLLTKPLGVGIITTAAKAGLAEKALTERIYRQMAALNRAARDVMIKYPVHSCTDVTGFALLGHSFEMAQGSGVTVHIQTENVPFHKEAWAFADMGLVPSGAYRNRDYAEAGVRLTREIAECIYVGVSTDTGCFKFSNTTAHTHAVAAACLTAGIDGGEINRALFETKSRPRFEMERIVFDTMEFHEDGAIAVAVLWRKDIDRVGADMDDLDSIASLTRQIEGVQIGITMTEKADGTVRVSVRTTREMDASAICKRVGGGGHVRAAGASFTCGMDEAKAEMLRVAKEQFHAAD